MRPRRPTPAAATPTLAAALAAAVVAGGACSTNDPTYFPETAPVALEVNGDNPMDPMMAGLAIGTVQLPFRRPSDVEEKQRQADSQRLGYEVPSLRADRVHIEVRYTVTNLDDKEGMFSVNFDGASEFTRYDEAAVAAAFEMADEDPVLMGLVQLSPQNLGPGQVYHGSAREDDFTEASLDIDALGRFAAPFVAVLINRSEVNPVGMEMMPAMYSIRPALWEVTLRFTSDLHMKCEFLVRVRDDDQRLKQGDQPLFMPEPETFMPEIMMN